LKKQFSKRSGILVRGICYRREKNMDGNPVTLFV
jgi:hypothetical protein